MIRLSYIVVGLTCLILAAVIAADPLLTDARGEITHAGVRMAEIGAGLIWSLIALYLAAIGVGLYRLRAQA